MAAALATPWAQMTQHNHSHFSQQAPFHQMVNTHHCFCYDENFVRAQFYSQNRRPVDVPTREVTQYPLVRTVQDEGDGCLVAVTADIERSRYLKVRGFQDRPLLVSYCPQDVHEVLMKNSLLQNYYKVVTGYLESPFLCGSTKSKEAFVIDFKPLWAIRRAMNQQMEMNVAQKRKQLTQKLTRPSLKKPIGFEKRHKSAKPEDDNGENIHDEDSASGRLDTSFIRCKPSLIQNKLGPGDDTEEHAGANMGYGSLQRQMDKPSFLKRHSGILATEGEARMRKAYGRKDLNATFMLGGDKSQNYFEENYLFEVLYNYERRILDSSEEEDPTMNSGGTRKFIDINFAVNAQTEIQVLAMEQDAGSKLYLTTCRLRLNPAVIQL